MIVVRIRAAGLLEAAAVVRLSTCDSKLRRARRRTNIRPQSAARWEVFSRFTMTFDYAHQMLYLKPFLGRLSPAKAGSNRWSRQQRRMTRRKF